MYVFRFVRWGKRDILLLPNSFSSELQMGNRLSERSVAILAGLVSVFLWGGSFVATKIALASFSPLTLITLRLSIGIIVLFILVVWKEKLFIPSRKEILPLILLGFIGFVINQWLNAYGIEMTSATQASWLTASAPVFMALMGSIFLREKVVAWQILGMGIAFSGVFLIAAGRDVNAPPAMDIWGSIIVLLGAIAWAAYSVLGKYLVGAVPYLSLTFYSMVFGWILLLPMVFFSSEWSFPSQLSTREGWAVLFLGLGSTGLAYAFYFFSLKGAETTIIAAIQYLEPIITLLLAAWLVAEKISLAVLVGGLLIILGVWLVNRYAADKDHST